MRTPALCAALLLATACRHQAPAPEPVALTAAQQHLVAVAQAAASATYTATYSFAEPATKDTGTIRIAAAPPQYRVDIATAGKTATFIASRRGTYSCASSRAATKKPTCLLVARPGEPVPDTFDPGIEHLFSDAVIELAGNPTHYSVAELAPRVGGGAVPFARCFRVNRSGSAQPSPVNDPAGFETGDYCFADQGVLVSARVATGTLLLIRLGPAPAAREFTPPAPAAVLPSLPAGPS
ncbi:MAG: hypothetical protein LC640_09755 [Frankia sp.]|nr:hypothetical protein [Frankia sp.]